MTRPADGFAQGVRMMTAIVRVLKVRFPNLPADETVELAGKIAEAVIEAMAEREQR